MGLTPTKAACGAGPDASGNLISRDLRSTLRPRPRETERHMASRSLRRSGFRGRLTATHPCRETHRGLGGTPALSDCLWPVMDSQRVVAPDCNGSHALLPSLLVRFARSLREATPRYRLVEPVWGRRKIHNRSVPGRPMTSCSRPGKSLEQSVSVETTGATVDHRTGASSGFPDHSGGSSHSSPLSSGVYPSSERASSMENHRRSLSDTPE